ncbi:hypothetical protein NDU88_006834 [Pleurodeles waltl]|uniref:Uncharacterized protein n=1 Tax=Pleurodeles waltl TaxID=8319 RepID=A0AAV7RNC6_PLEWA|nr:hypothetical protein NDU88_006834 [Pleurodeles waltl]
MARAWAPEDCRTERRWRKGREARAPINTDVGRASQDRTSSAPNRKRIGEGGAMHSTQPVSLKRADKSPGQTPLTEIVPCSPSPTSEIIPITALIENGLLEG